MNLQEQKLKKRVQVVVAACLSLFFVLVTVAVFQFAIRINQKNEEADLRAQSASLKRQIERAEHDKEYFESDEFKQDYLNRIK